MMDFTGSHFGDSTVHSGPSGPNARAEGLRSFSSHSAAEVRRSAHSETGHSHASSLPVDPHFIGFGRASTSAEGIYRSRTIRPGRVPGPGNSLQAPHLAVSVFGRGLIKRLATRLYFADGEGNDTDPVLAAVPADRRDTLIARRTDDGSWWLEIHLQGERETVFVDL